MSNLITIIEESGSMTDEIWEAIECLEPKKLIRLGAPLQVTARFRFLTDQIRLQASMDSAQL